jgi:hypothetical protein
MLRTITLSLLMLISVVAMLPFASSTAHGIRQSVSSGRYYKRHSRAWWRRYRARVRRKREAALAAHRNALLGPSLNLPTTSITSLDPMLAQPVAPAANPAAASAADMKLNPTKVINVPGQVSLSVVALSRPNPAYLSARDQSRMLAGLNVAELRRTVIEKMLTSGGWVTNDYMREVSGERVFVVTAQTPADGRSPEKSWCFYFTELNGRIYNLTTNTAPQYSDRMALEAQRFIESLRVMAPVSQPASR